MDTSVEARAVGCPFEFKENVPVITEHRYKTIESIVRIPVPDPNKTPCMKLNIDVIRGLSKIKPKSIISYVIGPVTLAAHFMGITDLIKLAMREKDLFHNTLKHCNKIIKPYAEALVNAGASSLIILEPQVGIFLQKHIENQSENTWNNSHMGCQILFCMYAEIQPLICWILQQQITFPD